jgi:hypothetical protein
VKTSEIKPLGIYEVKISGRLVPVRIMGVIDQAHGRCYWTGTNLVTDRKVRIRSPQKCRRELTPAEASILSVRASVHG